MPNVSSGYPLVRTVSKTSPCFTSAMSNQAVTRGQSLNKSPRLFLFRGSKNCLWLMGKLTSCSLEQKYQSQHPLNSAQTSLATRKMSFLKEHLQEMEFRTKDWKLLSKLTYCVSITCLIAVILQLLPVVTIYWTDQNLWEVSRSQGHLAFRCE